MRKTILILILTIMFIAAGVAVYYGQAQQAGNAVTAHLEASQIILPEGHPEFPLDTAWVVVQDQQNSIEVPIPLTIPDHWSGKYEIEMDGNVVFLKYSMNPEVKETIFVIAAMTDAQWQEIETEPTYHGEVVYQYNDIIYVYSHALDNPYTGKQADEFASLVVESRSIANSLAGYFTPIINAETLSPVLQSYFESLNAGQYEQAALIYGGDYDLLTGLNPEIPADDRGRLIEAACTTNGFMCGLKIEDIIQVEPISGTAVRFLVEMQNQDGTLFKGGCSESAGAACLAETQFEFIVQSQAGQFKVMTLPVYSLAESQDQAGIQPIELQQLILPDGHPEFPTDTIWVVVPNEPAHSEVPIPLTFPANWNGKYIIDQQDNIARYLYLTDTGVQETIFSITALTEADWQAIQNEPHGEALLSYGGIVWVYNPALENPYSGEQADEFSRMVGEAYNVAHRLSGFFTPQISQETTLPVLLAYFDTLGAGNYLEAARMYGGDLTQLIENNPEVSPDDGAALFESACTINGFICSLEIGEILQSQQVSNLAVQFTLTLHNPDGSPFELGPCCGEDPATTPVLKEFIYTVAWQDGIFQVLELPVYVP